MDEELLKKKEGKHDMEGGGRGGGREGFEANLFLSSLDSYGKVGGETRESMGLVRWIASPLSGFAQRYLTLHDLIGQSTSWIHGSYA